MQRSNAILSVLLLTLAAAGCGNLPAEKADTPSASPAPAMAGQVTMYQPGPKKVNVIVRCDTLGAAKFTIAPWKAEAVQGDTVTWNMISGANGPDSIEVTARNSNQWPFPELSYSSGGGETVSGKLGDNVPTGTYQYVLRISCPGRVIVIDPDIMVSRKH